MRLFKRLTLAFLVLIFAIGISGTAMTVDAVPGTFDAALETKTEFFPDAVGHWAEKDIYRAYSDGYLSGYEDGTFRPNEALSVAETVEILSKALDLEGTPGVRARIKVTKWYYEPACKAVAAGLVDRLFSDYERPVTREEALIMTAKGYGFAPEEVDMTVLDGYEDSVKISKDNKKLFAALVERDIINGWDGELHLEEALSRAEFVTILYRIADFNEEAWQLQKEEERRIAEEEARRQEEARLIAEEEAKKEEEERLYQERLHDPSTEEYKAEKERVFALVTSGYAGDYTLEWAKNNDYTDEEKEFWVNAKGYESSSKYLIWVNLTYQRCSIFSGSRGQWKLIRSSIVGTGANGSPTPRGTWKVTYHNANGWTTSTYTVKPVIGFKGGGYAFHSRLYYPRTTKLLDSSIGYPVSHGCVRMYYDDVNWIYDNIPDGTTVVVY